MGTGEDALKTLTGEMEDEMKKKCLEKRRNFSLLELLIVVVIIVILAGLLLPALNKARKKGMAVDCIGNLRSLGSMVAFYENDFQRQPYATWNRIPVADGGWGDYQGVPAVGDSYGSGVLLYWAGLLRYAGYQKGKYNYYGGIAGVTPVLTCKAKNAAFPAHSWNYMRNVKYVARFGIDYGSNYMHWTGFSPRSEQIRKPSSLAMHSDSFIGDSSHYAGNINTVFNEMIHSGSINVYFFDGHCASVPYGAIANRNSAYSNNLFGGGTGNW